jgi:protein transport protein SEC31
MGLVAGGMMDGIVHIWNPQSLMKKEESALVASINQHEGGAVKALKFNGLVPNELATGGSDGQVLITSLDTPNQPVVALPGTEPSKGAQVTQLAWNSQVAHIVASAASDGIVSVWDLKSKRPWCRLQAESSGISVSDVAWNPSQGLHMITASVDDRNPILKVWDLRASTTMPLATLSGHSQGILSLAWCPHDDTLLLTCGKDNRTILWDLHALKPIADIPIDEPAPTSMEQQNQGSSSDVFSSTAGLSSSQQRRYDVQWSPLKRGVVSTCSLDRKVQAHSVIGLATVCNCCFGFLVCYALCARQLAPHMLIFPSFLSIAVDLPNG